MVMHRLIEDLGSAPYPPACGTKRLDLIVSRLFDLDRYMYHLLFVQATAARFLLSGRDVDAKIWALNFRA